MKIFSILLACVLFPILCSADQPEPPPQLPVRVIGEYQLDLPPPETLPFEITLTASVDGEVLATKTASVSDLGTFRLDLDNSEQVGLADAIMILRMLTGESTPRSTTEED